MSLTILVTGGAGFVGSHVAVDFLNAGHSVIAIDNCCNSYYKEGNDMPESLKRVEKITGKSVIFEHADLCDRKCLEEIFKKHKIDCVCHLAAHKYVGESMALPLKYYQNNLIGALTLLEVMNENGIHNMIFSSSTTVYGDPKYLPMDEKHPTGNCTNPYGSSKFFVEQFMKDLCVADKRWRIISLRYFNPIGAHESGILGEDPNGVPSQLLPYITQVAVGKLKSLKIFGNDFDTVDGTGVRDYIHVSDLADGHLSALVKLYSGDIKGFEPYNLGLGRGHSVLEVIKSFIEVSGIDVPFEFAPRRPGDIGGCYSSTEKAEKELGWKAKKNLNDMCEDAWRFQKNNPNGYNQEN